MTVYARPGTTGSIVPLKTRYENFIGGDWVKPAQGQLRRGPRPGDRGSPSPSTPRSPSTTSTSPSPPRQAPSPAGQRPRPRTAPPCSSPSPTTSQANLEKIAVLESWENGKPVRETLAADIPLAIDHFRYFAAAIRTQEGNIKKLTDDLVSYHFFEPIGVVAQIIPWNFPILMATWKLAPASPPGTPSCSSRPAPRPSRSCT
jgi:aldehyde dehydrogenase